MLPYASHVSYEQLAVFQVLAFYIGHAWGMLIENDLLVRYAVLDPNPTGKYLQQHGLPMLRSSLCLAERHLAPAIWAFFQVNIVYVIYTDAITHGPVQAILSEYFSVLQNRIKIVNLDDALGDMWSTAWIHELQLDPVNLASCTRLIADAALLPSESARLLLGIDISFIAEPLGLVKDMQQRQERQALYMADLTTFNRTLYKLTAYTGPQCAGLMADFVFLAPGVHISVENIVDKMKWYSSLPREPERTSPPSLLLAVPGSRGLHAIDQFALNLALAEAVEPAGSAGCFPLDSARYWHTGGVMRSWGNQLGIEAKHDKVTSSCGLACFDQCDSFMTSYVDTDACQSSKRVKCNDDPQGSQKYSKEMETMLAMLCFSDSYLIPLAHTLYATPTEHFTAMPRYSLYTNDRTCSSVSLMLHRELPHVAGRTTLINLDREINLQNPIWAQSELSAGVGSCAASEARGSYILALEITFVAASPMIREQLGYLNASRYLYMSGPPTVRYRYSADPDDLYEVNLSFCLCGVEYGIRCPEVTLEGLPRQRQIQLALT